MAVTMIFDPDSLVVEPHEFTEEDRIAFSEAIAAAKQRPGHEEAVREGLKLLERIQQASGEQPAQNHDI